LIQWNSPVVIICLTLFIVVGINAAIYAMLYKGDALKQIELLQRASNQMHHPWESEDKALAELSKQVKDLQENRHEQADDIS